MKDIKFIRGWYRVRVGEQLQPATSYSGDLLPKGEIFIPGAIICNLNGSRCNYKKVSSFNYNINIIIINNQ